MENFNEYFMILLFAWSVIQSALMYRAIPRGAWDKLIDAYMERAAQTEMTLDDNIGHVVKSNVTPILERFGIFEDIEEKNEDNPLVTLPDATPVTPTGFEDIFGKRDTLSTFTWKKEGHADAVIEMPEGYSQDRNYQMYDNNGKWYPRKAINTNDNYGTRLNIAHVAGVYIFPRRKAAAVEPGHYIASLTYNADVNTPDIGQPFFNWIQAKLYVNGEPLFARDDVNLHHSLENGSHTIEWEYKPTIAQAVQVTLEIAVHYGLAEGNSVVDLKSLSLKKA